MLAIYIIRQPFCISGDDFICPVCKYLYPILSIYQYALIEARKEGIANYDDTDEEQWHKWDNDRERFYEINRPECLNGYCRFAL